MEFFKCVVCGQKFRFNEEQRMKEHTCDMRTLVAIKTEAQLKQKEIMSNFLADMWANTFISTEAYNKAVNFYSLTDKIKTSEVKNGSQKAIT